MNPEQLLRFLEKLDKLVAGVLNPPLNRFEHAEIAQGLKGVYEYIKNSEEDKLAKTAEKPVKVKEGK